MALRDLINDLASGGAAALRGIGESATLGLSRYPAALIYSKTMGVPYEEALASVRAQEEQLRKEQAAPYMAGKIAGSLATLPVGGAARGILPAIGRGAVQGGVVGFTERPGMENVVQDVGLGAALGGTLSGAAGAAAKGQEFIVKNAYIAQQAKNAERAMQRGNEALSVVTPAIQRVAPNATPEQANTILRSIASGKSKMGNFSPDEVKAARTAVTASMTSAKSQGNVATMNQLAGQDVLDLAKSSLTYGTKKDAREFFDYAKEAAKDVAFGGAAGAGLSLVTGQDPLTGAGVGAGLGGLWELKQKGFPVKMKAASAAGARIPLAAGETMARGATLFGTPVITNVARPMPAGEPQMPEIPAGAAEAKPWERDWSVEVPKQPAVEAPAVAEPVQKPWERKWD